MENRQRIDRENLLDRGRTAHRALAVDDVVVRGPEPQLKPITVGTPTTARHLARKHGANMLANAAAY